LRRTNQVRSSLTKENGSCLLRDGGIKVCTHAYQETGYTPTDPVTVIRPTREEGIKQRQEDEFQRVFLLMGFNAKELVNMGAYPDLNAQYNILSNPVPYV
jgi:hypothetical protein